MPEIDDLYQELILDHAKRPRNFRSLPDADRRAEGFNRLCGDRVTVFVKLEGDPARPESIVREVSFQGVGCAISTASASLLTEALRGKTTAQAESLFRRFHALVTGKATGASAASSSGAADADAHAAAAGADAEPDLGKLEAFAGVSEFPIRVKCASLAWHTFHAALTGEHAPVTTE